MFLICLFSIVLLYFNTVFLLLYVYVVLYVYNRHDYRCEGFMKTHRVTNSLQSSVGKCWRRSGICSDPFVSNLLPSVRMKK